MKGFLRSGCQTLVAGLYFFTVVVAQPAGLPQPEVISDRQGLPQAFVSAIVQDRQGFIWMATRDGLCRFDGTRFKIFQQETNGRPSLSFNGVAALTIDHQNRIWVGTIRGGIDIFDPQHEAFFDQFSVLFRFNEQEGPRVVAHLPVNQECISLFMDRSDVLWMGTNGSSVHKYDLRALPFQAQPYRKNFVYDLVTDGLKQPAAQVPATLEKPDRTPFDMPTTERAPSGSMPEAGRFIDSRGKPKS